MLKLLRKLFRIRKRGFEPVSIEKRKHRNVIQLPKRADKGSAGNDFYSPETVIIHPGEKMTIWTDVKSYMLPDEVIKIYIRSSLGIKKGLVLANDVGIIDASYYNNDDNEGNIGICLLNGTDEPVLIEAGDRIAQGIFQKYLLADEDEPAAKIRTAGIGSSGK